MFTRFSRGPREVLVDARAEARAAGSRSVEAEHVLLALSGSAGGPAAAVLDAAGLGRETLLTALELQETRALALAGVHVDEPPPPTPAVREPRFADSAKLALARALEAAQDAGAGTIDTAHLLLGVLAAEVGTVPLALAAIDVDRSALADAARAVARQR